MMVMLAILACGVSSGSACPRVKEIECPLSGEVTVLVAPSVLGAAYECNLELRHD